MTQAPKIEVKELGKDQPAIHRVCVTCNGMFRVTPENYEAKQCPNCHKG